MSGEQVAAIALAVGGIAGFLFWQGLTFYWFLQDRKADKIVAIHKEYKEANLKYFKDQ